MKENTKIKVYPVSELFKVDSEVTQLLDAPAKWSQQVKERRLLKRRHAHRGAE